MEMERLKTLHNFDFPCLKWGNQKLLRCMKVDSKAQDVSIVRRKHSPVIGNRRREVEFDRRFRSSGDRKAESFDKFSSPEKLKAVASDGEIEATREKLMFDFQTEVGRMKDAILRESVVVPALTPTPAPAPATTSISPTDRPWNLRTRRAACKAPPFNGVNRNGDVSPATNECKPPATAITRGEKRDRPRFSVSVSRRESEVDFTAITGRRLPRKPKKRPRIVQKQLDTLFPGLWLTEITPDLYRVADDTETKTK